MDNSILFHDSIFEQRLIDWGYDTIHDGQLLTLNIVNVDSLTFDVPTHLFGNPILSHQIKDFTGIDNLCIPNLFGLLVKCYGLS